MAAMIQGMEVILYKRVQNGADAFGAPVWEEIPETVSNVLVCPVSAEDVTDGLKLYGKRAEYQLCLPKGDDHTWEGCRVSFFGQDFRVFGPVIRYMEENTPLDWNRKAKVERYG